MDANSVASVMLAVGWVPNIKDKQKCITFLDTALAVCYAESGFDPAKPNPSSSAIGLWQIMQSQHGPEIKKAIDKWSKQFGKTLTITDPYVNTEVAYQLFKVRGWQPWKAYNNHAYKSYLGKGAAAYTYLTQFNSGKVINDSVAEVAMNTPGVVLDAGKDAAFGWVGDALSGIASFALPVGIFILGAILLIVGLWLAAGSPSLPTPAGAIVKAVA